jgi:predicted membrane-bound spermidine synthase
MGLYLGIFLVTLSGLMFEIALTRIFSATIWYHFAFVAISVALLGWGLGGFAVHLLRRRLAPSLERAGLLTLLFGLSIPLSLWLMVRLPFLPSRLAFYFVVSLVPFLLAGAALAMLFALGPERAGRLYFADLTGASLGAVLVTFLLSWLGGERAVLALSVLPLVAAACFAPRLRAASAGATLLVLAALVVDGRTGAFEIRSAPAKALYRHMAATPGTRIVLTGWNAYSRIDAVTGFEKPYLARLYIDSDAWTNVHRWDGRIESVAFMRDWYRALPFRLVPSGPRTLVIGPGGGADVLAALAAGSERVTAVEMNPLMLGFVRHFGAAAGNLYDQPRVETILSEGRTFVRRTDRRFDVILLGFVDSWAAVASGGLSLSENHLYTVEAFRAYLDHLTPDGALVILRWADDAPRLVSNAVALLGPAAAGRR